MQQEMRGAKRKSNLDHRSPVVALLIPIPYLAAPVWQVAVFDGAGVALEGMTVRRLYKNYAAEAEGHEDYQTTGRQGRANFAAKWSSASIARRCIFSAFSALAGVPASFGRNAYVLAFGNGREGYAVSGGHVFDWAGKPAQMDSRITAAPPGGSRLSQ
jgi:hypothetical protein